MQLQGGLDQTKAVVVVAFTGVVPVAVRRTQVVRFVVPRAAAQNMLASPKTGPPCECYLIEQGFAQCIGIRMESMAYPALYPRVNVRPV